MLQRCLLELSSGRSVARRRRQITAQTFTFLSSRNFSNASKQNSSKGPAPTEKTSRSGNYVSKLVLGSVVVGAAAMAAYQTGYIGLNAKNEKSSLNSSKLDARKALEHLEHSVDQVILPSNEQQSKLKPDMETVKKNDEPEENDEPHDLKDLEINREVASEITPEEEPVPVLVKENELSSFPQEITPTPVEQTVDSKSSDDPPNMDSSKAHTEPHVEQKKATETSMEQHARIDCSTNVSEESGTTEADSHHGTSMEMPKDSLDNEAKAPKPLSQSYSLQVDEGEPEVSGKEETVDVGATILKDKEASVVTNVNAKDTNKSGDGKIILDLIEAIDAAKRMQAESDAYIFAEEKRMLKEKYEKELKDARARELMYAEEAAILDKELNKEKLKAAATVKLVQEKAEQNLQEELQHKEEEVAIQLKKVQELAKAELAAAIASEKSSQIEKIAEANLHINALCMAFYARSEEARQTHSVHKLALGTLALEDALSKGLPIRAEVDALHKSLEGIDRDSLLDLVLSSLPEETLDYGTSTQMQLNQKFDSLKGSLRHFSLIPSGGGGILAHTVAHIASSIKVREDQSGEGIESLISKVESFLVEGKIAEAADALEGGVRGSEAEAVVVEWARLARNRAVAEQALSLLQSYATSITFG